jgi:pilus assembly protein CpaE
MAASLQIPDALVSGAVLSIAVIGPGDQRRNTIIEALTRCHTGQIREFIAYPASVNDAAQMLLRNYDLVLVDLDSNPEFSLDLVESICIHGSASVMVYSEQSDPDIIVRSMRAGAREFIRIPLANGAVAEALVRASARRPPSFAPQKPDGGLFVFLGAKGGAGVTTLACNFALSLSQESAKSTLLIDLNLPLGDATINLGIKTEYSTVQALQNANRLDANFLSSLLVSYSPLLSVLAAPSEMTPCQASNDAVDRLLAVARQQFDYVVVDAGSRLDLQRTVLFNECATIYLITQVGIPELRNANRVIAQFLAEGSPKLEVVLNRYESNSLGIPDEQISKALTQPPHWKVPNNYAAVRKMQNTATPLALEDSSIARTIRQMARTVCGKPEPAKEQKKKGFHLFR